KQLSIFGVHYDYFGTVYELPASINGCVVKIIDDGTWEMTAIIRDIATDHTTKLLTNRFSIDDDIEMAICRYRTVSNWHYIATIKNQRYMPRSMFGKIDYTVMYESQYQEFYVQRSSDKSCWMYDSESLESGIFPNTVQPSAAHFTEWVLSNIKVKEKTE
ncbi:hypothetical protein UFOVP1490_1, partial [uncultured Caudovirales phage]